MKALQWDVMSIPERPRSLAAWNLDDIGGTARIVEHAWEELPAEVRLIIKTLKERA